MSKLTIGDRVAYSALFLRSVGTSHAAPRNRLRGTIVGFAPDFDELAEIDWGSHRSHVNVFNLVRVRQIAAEASRASGLVPTEGWGKTYDV